jgi:hypothetical protein
MISELADRFERRAKTKRSERVIETVRERPFMQWLLPLVPLLNGTRVSLRKNKRFIQTKKRGEHDERINI